MANRLVVLSIATLGTLASLQPAHAEATRNRTEPAEVSVTVRLENKVGVAEWILKAAKARTTEIYSRIGVDVAWLDAHDAIRQKIRPPYTVVLMTPQAEKRKALSDGITEDVIGQAVPIARRAYVYYQRLMAKVALPERDIVTLLGYAMAHELGHLMLPAHSHSPTGVMRPNFDRNSRAAPAFSDAEATAIRRRLADDERTWISRQDETT